jgi:hypothetical protein
VIEDLREAEQRGLCGVLHLLLRGTQVGAPQAGGVLQALAAQGGSRGGCVAAAKAFVTPPPACIVGAAPGRQVALQPAGGAAQGSASLPRLGKREPVHEPALPQARLQTAVGRHGVVRKAGVLDVNMPLLNDKNGMSDN